MTRFLPAALAVLATALPAAAQQFPSEDPVLQAIWNEGMNRSQVRALGQTLLDSIGPRLTGTPTSEHASAWVMSRYEDWGIETYTEEYGTWRGWDRGITHVDLISPRVRSLNGTMLAWSPGTDGPVESEVLILPKMSNRSELDAFLPRVFERFVLVSWAPPTCRPDSHVREFATDDSYQRMEAARTLSEAEWQESLRSTGLTLRQLAVTLEDAGAAGVITTRWPGGWGATRVFSAYTETVPSLVLGCEDYGLLARLASNDQGPRLRVDAQAEHLGDVPVWNTMGRIEGTEKPDEFVVLSAHFDSWDGASGATDNGTGTLTMMEAMRILRAVYPSPKRTILVGHWNGEEQGLNGSRAFAADHPEVVEGLQALFNQDNGTGRVVRISAQGLLHAGAFFGRWLAQIPPEISEQIDLILPGSPGGGGSDYASFICGGAPAFSLSSLNWQYSPYTWHTDLDTFDKVMTDEVQNNATLTAMLAYLASEEPERIPRERRVLGPDRRSGGQAQWPACRDATRRYQVRR